MSVSKVLAEIAINRKASDIPESSFAAAKKLIIDTIGVAFAGSDAPGVKEVLELQDFLGGNPQASILFHGNKLPVHDAAFANSVMVHALDYDDVYSKATLHIMSSVFPASLACAEFKDKSGTELMEAIVLGVETAAMIGINFSKAERKHNYFLPSSIIGGFGATAAAGRLWGLSVEELVNAFGIFYAHASGNRLALIERALTKRMQPAISARAAVYSVLAAEKGISGPEEVFEGKAGLFKVYTESLSPSEESFLNGSGKYEIENVLVKRYPTCGGQHAAIHAALKMKKKIDFDIEQINKVELYLGEGDTMVGMPFTMGENPQADAQFCAPFAVALALTKGRVDPDLLTNECIRADKLTAELAQNMEILKTWEYSEADYPPVPGQGRWVSSPQIVRVVLKNGQAIEEVCTPWDVKNPPMSMDDVIKKFKSCASYGKKIMKLDADKIINQITNLENSSSIKELISNCLSK